MSRLIRQTGQQAIYLAGPGHGGPALVAAGYLEGTYSEVYPEVTPGRGRACCGCSGSSPRPGGIPSHVSVTTPGSIHEGGELGYVLVHAFGAVMDNPDLLAVAVVGDGEAETGPLEGSWKGISFLNPARDGAVLPVLHLNGAKISGPTVLAPQGPGRGARRCSRATATRSSRSRATTCPACTTGSPPPSPRPGAGSARSRMRRAAVTGRRAAALADDRAAPAQGLDRPGRGRRRHRSTGTLRSHQVPLSGVRDNPDHLRCWRLAPLVPPGGALRRTGPRSSSSAG